MLPGWFSGGVESPYRYVSMILSNKIISENRCNLWTDFHTVSNIPPAVF